MPRLSDTMEEGAISTWRKQPGDTVAVGDVLVEIETDKAVMEYEAYQAGTLAEILVPEGRNADIGAPIALLDDGTGSPAPSVPAAEPHVAPERRQPAPSGTTAPSAPAPPPAAASPAASGSANGGSVNGGGRQIASPLVRKLARENHLDLSHVTGSGPGGRIIRADISHLLSTRPVRRTARACAGRACPCPRTPAAAPRLPCPPRPCRSRRLRRDRARRAGDGRRARHPRACRSARSAG